MPIENENAVKGMIADIHRDLSMMDEQLVQLEKLEKAHVQNHIGKLDDILSKKKELMDFIEMTVPDAIMPDFIDYTYQEPWQLEQEVKSFEPYDTNALEDFLSSLEVLDFKESASLIAAVKDLRTVEIQYEDQRNEGLSQQVVYKNKKMDVEKQREEVVQRLEALEALLKDRTPPQDATVNVEGLSAKATLGFGFDVKANAEVVSASDVIAELRQQLADKDKQIDRLTTQGSESAIELKDLDANFARGVLTKHYINKPNNKEDRDIGYKQSIKKLTQHKHLINYTHEVLLTNEHSYRAFAYRVGELPPEVNKVKVKITECISGNRYCCTLPNYNNKKAKVILKYNIMGKLKAATWLNGSDEWTETIEEAIEAVPNDVCGIEEFTFEELVKFNKIVEEHINSTS